MPTPSRMALLDIAERLNLRTGQLFAAIDLLDEIEIREGASPAQTLAREEIRRACLAQGSGPWRAAAFLEALRKIRFPRLKRGGRALVSRGRSAQTAVWHARRLAQGPRLR